MANHSKTADNASTSAERVLQKASRLDAVTRVLCVIALVAAVLLSILPLFSAFTISANMNDGIVDEAATAVIAPVLPLGYACMPLVVLGIVVATVLLLKKKPLVSLFGVGIMLIGGAFLVLFALACGEAFPYREFPVGGGIREVGLQFTDLLWRYYIALVSPLLLLISLIPAFRAQYLRGIADMMTTADTPATISLGESDPAE